MFGVPETSFALPHSLTYSLARTEGPLSGAKEGPTLWREQEAHSPARTGGPLSGASRGPTLWREQGAHSLARAGRPLSGASRAPTLWREQGAHSLERAGSPLSGTSRGPTLWREQGARFYYWPNYVGGPINDVEMNCACCSCSGLSLSGVTFNYYSRHMAKRFDLIFKLLDVSFCLLDPGCWMLDA